ncbi:type II CRISPR RNA-guided endonuclease Cas9 [uncultured Parolsenella sp.]|uniref:type II CRISPR RNA-guided endonuclease Cas9 n=1 Tax=uncultured Parolsenella sp. TaxID=2083008 RepID=UPI0025CE4B21|nr:type II CRISPR RNA-guided endonuclease Cas9 [uncultured Parolsenella sp.]
MNLRNYRGSYSIGLDMGTGSVGWSVVDENGKLLHFKKQPTWGSRLFDSAQPASEARAHRGQRRRYVRRRWRLNLLQDLFSEEMSRVDPEFFTRLNMSRLVEGDPIFNGDDFTIDDYYRRFPTIYHLRKWLMETDEKADLRLVYLAMHNIVKHRGNFLREDEKNLRSEDANPKKASKAFFAAFSEWCLSHDYDKPTDKSEQLDNILRNEEKLNRSSLAQEIAPLIVVSGAENLDPKRASKAFANAMLGLAAEFKDIFGDFACEKTKVSLGAEEDLDALKEACPDDSVELLDALCGVYSAFVLQGLLSYAPGESISANMIKKYEQYDADLEILKGLVREYCSKEAYRAFFRGPTYHELDAEDPSEDYSYDKAQGYTAYNLHKLGYDDFKKEVEKLFKGTSATSDEHYADMIARFERQQFLRRLKTSDNGSIYYQLHLEELKAIIENQGRFYPFLRRDAAKIESLVSFRIPYYVGPLTGKNARQDAHGKNRFQWSERKPGMEDAVITPWNWDQVIDKNKSAENFILRMTGDCTYLAGEKTLPKCSLLYEEFCVLNELNGVRWSDDGDNWPRLTREQREGIVRDLFHKHKTVKYDAIADWLVRNGYAPNAHVKGGQGASALESKLSSWFFFTKDILHVDDIVPGTKLFEDVETIILWGTLFEDRGILKEKLEAEFGAAGSGLLDTAQIKAICSKKRFMGWGRLSKKFLCGLKVDAQNGRKVSIMDVLREGNPNSTRRNGETMVMMEALRDEDLGFQKAVDAANRAYYAEEGSSLGVNDLPGSPAIRRSLYQAIRIVDEIVDIAGHAPANIFIEVTRDEDERNKGKRTRRRYEQLKAALDAIKKDDPQVWEEFKGISPADLDERLTLYFMQRGRCLYSGHRIKIEQLSNAGLYEVDHIIPRAYIKDDSLENKALVYREENQRKTDELLLDEGIRRKRGSYWQSLYDARLIGRKKFSNLKRSEIKEDSSLMKSFIARQLVETSQMVKLVQSLLEARYADEGTKIVPVKASMSHDLREAVGFVKCREANDYHHAHDAYLACRIGLFIQMRHPGIYDNPIGYARVVKNYVSSQAKIFNRTHQMPGSAGFVINSFLTSGFDRETGEVFKDTWDANAEVEGIRRVLNYRQCYISRMPYADSGAFWNANPIAKRKNPKLELKRGLDPLSYGGYDSKTAAYFFIYKAKDKREKSVLKLVQLPVYIEAAMAKGNITLEEYARKDAEGRGLSLVEIKKSRLLKNQMVEIGGSRLWVTGEEEMKCASQLAFSLDEMELICAVLGRSSQESELTEIVYKLIAARLAASDCGMLKDNLSLDDRESSFAELPFNDQCDLIEKLLLLCRGNKKSLPINLSSIGGAKTAGRLRPARSSVPDDFVIIDQSVTGMFERKTRVGL